jgi:hypothetical protein
MNRNTLLKHSFHTLFKDLVLHKLKTDARYLTTVSFCLSFLTLLTPVCIDGAGLTNPDVVSGVPGGFII